MFESKCPRHGRIMRASDRGYCSLRCFFQTGPYRQCGLKTKVSKVDEQ